MASRENEIKTNIDFDFLKSAVRLLIADQEFMKDIIKLIPDLDVTTNRPEKLKKPIESKLSELLTQLRGGDIHHKIKVTLKGGTVNPVLLIEYGKQKIILRLLCIADPSTKENPNYFSIYELARENEQIAPYLVKRYALGSPVDFQGKTYCGESLANCEQNLTELVKATYSSSEKRLEVMLPLANNLLSLTRAFAKTDIRFLDIKLDNLLEGMLVSDPKSFLRLSPNSNRVPANLVLMTPLSTSDQGTLSSSQLAEEKDILYSTRLIEQQIVYQVGIVIYQMFTGTSLEDILSPRPDFETLITEINRGRESQLKKISENLSGINRLVVVGEVNAQAIKMKNSLISPQHKPDFEAPIFKMPGMEVWADFIKRCTNKDRSQRPNSANLGLDLGGCPSDSTVKHRGSSVASSSKSPRGYAVASSSNNHRARAASLRFISSASNNAASDDKQPPASSKTPR